MKNLLIFSLFFSLMLIGCYKSENPNKSKEEIINELFTSAEKYQKQDDYKSAIKTLEKALEIKEDAHLRSCLGSAYKLSCDYENALKNFQMAVENKKDLTSYDYVITMLGIGDSQFMLSKDEDSLKTYTTLQEEIPLSEFPEDKKVDMILGMAKARWRNKQCEEAIELFKLAMSIEDKGFMHVGLSRVQASMGDYEGAIKSCLEAISLEDSTRTWVGLGEAKERSGDLKGALKEYKTALTKKSMGKTSAEVAFERQEIENRIKRVNSRIKEMEQ